MSIVGAFIVPHPPLIVHEVGKGSEEQIARTRESYIQIAEEISSLKPDTIIVSSPHAPLYRDGFYLSDGEVLTGDFSKFGASNVTFQEMIDLDLVDMIFEVSRTRGVPVGRVSDIELDHGTMVPLYFIRKKYNDFKLVVLGISDLSLYDHYKMGEIIQEAVHKTNKKVVYIASGDLSHKLQTYGPYGFVEEGPIYDKRIMEDASKGDFYSFFHYSEDFLDKASPCGHWSFLMMAGALDGIDVKSRFYSHEDVTGVGYGICSYYPLGFDSRRRFGEKYLKEHESNYSKDPYISLAQKTIYHYIMNHERIDTSNCDPILLKDRAGVFVSIHKFGKLRGCIGTFLPTKKNIAEEIIQNSISASTKDYRFDAITSSELPYLDINVDVLSTPEDILSKNELDPKKYGVIVSSGIKRGLLLPDLEGVDDIDTQIQIAKNKAGITDDEEISLQRFQVIRHKDS